MGSVQEDKFHLMFILIILSHSFYHLQTSTKICLSNEALRNLLKLIFTQNIRVCFGLNVAVYQ